MPRSKNKKPLHKCLFCDTPVKRISDKTCGSVECRKKSQAVYNSIAWKKRVKERRGDWPKCRFCGKPVSRSNAMTCKSIECKKALKREYNALYRKEPVQKEPLPKCQYCDRTVSRRGSAICGLHSCRLKQQADYRKFHADKNRKTEAAIGFSVAKLRSYFGLEPIKKGKIKCHRCGKTFKSDDVKRERHCQNCRNIMGVMARGTVQDASFRHSANRAASMA